jgi:hypothetical protein
MVKPLEKFCELFPCDTCAFQPSCAIRSDVIGWKKKSFPSKERLRYLAKRCSEMHGDCKGCRYVCRCIKAFNVEDYDALKDILAKATRL